MGTARRAEEQNIIHHRNLHLSSTSTKRSDASAKLISLNVGLPQDVSWHGKILRTAGPRRVHHLNIEGDGQGDLQGHGGPNRAVMVYPTQGVSSPIAAQMHRIIKDRNSTAPDTSPKKSSKN
jgi:MOSC domain-containing protein YiiM